MALPEYLAKAAIYHRRFLLERVVKAPSIADFLNLRNEAFSLLDKSLQYKLQNSGISQSSFKLIVNRAFDDFWSGG